MKLREFKTYREMQQVHQEDMNNFPIIYLFGTQRSKAELDEKLKKIDATSLDDCCSIYGAGDVINKKDKQKYIDLCRVHKAERKLFAEDTKHLEDMIYTEMCNHEYSFTEDPEDTLTALGMKYEDLQMNSCLKVAWSKAAKRCHDDCY